MGSVRIVPAAARGVGRLLLVPLAVGHLAVALLDKLASRRLYWRKVGGKRWR
jgi:hypothetical protein